MDLLREGASYGFLNVRMPDDESICFSLIRGGQENIHSEYIDFLLSHGTNLGDQDTTHGNTPLLWAIANANNGSALTLIHKMSKEQINLPDRYGKRALHLAIGKGHTTQDSINSPISCSNLTLVEALIKQGADINCPDNNGNTPLHYAALRRDIPMMKALLDAGADPASENSSGDSPLDRLDVGYIGAYRILQFQTVALSLDEVIYENSYTDAQNLLQSR